MSKRFSILFTCLFTLIFSMAVFAQDPPKTQSPPNGRQKNGKLKKLKKMDANKDGQITREEWKGRARGFQKADRNNDGIITKDELKGRRRNG